MDVETFANLGFIMGIIFARVVAFRSIRSATNHVHQDLNMAGCGWSCC